MSGGTPCVLSSLHYRLDTIFSFSSVIFPHHNNQKLISAAATAPFCLKTDVPLSSEARKAVGSFTAACCVLKNPRIRAAIDCGHWCDLAVIAGSWITMRCKRWVRILVGYLGRLAAQLDFWDGSGLKPIVNWDLIQPPWPGLEKWDAYNEYQWINRWWSLFIVWVLNLVENNTF